MGLPMQIGFLLERSRTALLCPVGVAGVDLFQVDDLSLNVEPEAGRALEGRLVLPPVMGGTVSGHQTQLTLQLVVEGGFELGCPGQEIP